MHLPAGNALAIQGNLANVAFGNLAWPSWGVLPSFIAEPGLKSHLTALNDVAIQHGNRAIGPGHAASAEYVLSVLGGLSSYDISTQYFSAPVWTENEPPVVKVSGPWSGTLQPNVDVRSMRYGGPSAVIEGASLYHVPDGGCTPKSFESFPPNSVGLIEAGQKACDYWDAAYSAEKAGAIALIFYNPPRLKSLLGSRVRIVEWKKYDPLMGIPVLSATHTIGTALIAKIDSAKISISVNNTLKVVETFNVLAETKTGDADSVVVVGAHLDGVPEGPGLVDNGSGSTAILEVAVQLHKSGIARKLVNKIRFAWWGSEEVGLLGSRHYVRDMMQNHPSEYKKIVMSVNHDMLGSPNGIPFIFDGYSAPEPIRNQSLVITHLYATYWNRTHHRTPRTPKPEPYELLPMVAGSDFLPFVQNGVPTGGLETGAGQTKTREQAQTHGGFANAPLDPCYHQPCDDIDNVNIPLLLDNTKLVAFVVETTGTKLHLREWLVEAGAQLRSAMVGVNEREESFRKRKEEVELMGLE
ncbi:hypothetical protein BJ742DRAFT_763966 [Cladochytrium replicatum]|nr:hypothetical protein BJ742DRAFT_763966 [Cladochytrium replicatum]